MCDVPHAVHSLKTVHIAALKHLLLRALHADVYILKQDVTFCVTSVTATYYSSCADSYRMHVRRAWHNG